MGSFSLVLLLVFAVIALIGFILVWVKKFFYVKKDVLAVSIEKRGLAFFFDWVLMHLLLVFGYIIIAGLNGVLTDQTTQYIIMVKEQGTQRFWYDVRFVEFYIVVAYVLYSFIGELLFSRTIGKQMLGLRVRFKGQRVIAVLLRNMVKLPVVLLWPVGLVLASCNKKRRWGHDYLSKTHLESVEE